ncbi:MAG TPA: histidine kinase [Blastocatellia bacterium]|nr:histidine kinase [Blastocatellia bacterium]
MLPSASLNEKASIASTEARMIAIMRLVLASSALLIICLDPSEPDRLVRVTYTALVLYTSYSLLLLVLTMRGVVSNLFRRLAHWVDIGWYLLLIALSSGTSSIFFYFFFFSILVASFRWGFSEGVLVTVISTALFTIIGYATAPKGPDFELNRFLMRPTYLLALGYMVSYWGGLEIKLLRRLALLKEVSVLSNPRFGVDRTLSMVLDRLCSFYDADHCLAVLKDFESGAYVLHRARRKDRGAEPQNELISEGLASRLVTLPAECSVVYNARRRWLSFKKGPQVLSKDRGATQACSLEVCEALAATLDADSFVSVRLSIHGEVIGRVYLTSRRVRFDGSDCDFLSQVFEHVMPVIENVRLVDRLASYAAEEERQRIARDIHDSVIQPYIGLQMGLTAVSKKISAGGAEVSTDIARLIEMTDGGISDLRRYVRGLSESGEHESSLMTSVRRFAEKFAEATGIAVRVEAEQEIRVNDRLAAEAFHLIAEALSNIRRHTHAREAVVRVACPDNRLLLKIDNDNPDGISPAGFTPRSITDRASALGGQAHIEQKEGGYTSVVIQVPL